MPAANARRLAEAVERTSAADVESDSELLAKAESLRPEQFTKEARRWTVECQDDGGASEHARQQARRGLRVWDGDDGMVHYGGCFHCGAEPGICQAHHIEPVSQGGPTKLDNLVPACWTCHHRIHHDGWRIHKSPDGNHTLHPPDHIHYGPAQAPDPPVLFGPSDHNSLEASAPPVGPHPAAHVATGHAGPRTRSGPASARAALRSARNERAGPAQITPKECHSFGHCG